MCNAHRSMAVTCACDAIPCNVPVNWSVFQCSSVYEDATSGFSSVNDRILSESDFEVAFAEIFFKRTVNPQLRTDSAHLLCAPTALDRTTCTIDCHTAVCVIH